MTRIILFLLLTEAACSAQPHLEMPMLGAPLPQTKFELVNKISPARLVQLPKELPTFKWSEQPRNFPVTALQTLLDETPFAGTNVVSLFLNPTNPNDGIKLVSRDNEDYFIVMPAAGRIAVQHTDRTREDPPPDAVPDFEAVWRRALSFAEMFGVSTNEMERNQDGAVHIMKTENTISHLGGSIRYKSRRSVTVFRSIQSYLVRSLDQDKIELELGVDGCLLTFNFKWPNIEAIRTNKVVGIAAIIDEIKKGEVLGDVMNEYPSDGIAEIELKDFQVFYYVSEMFPYSKRSRTNAHVYPMIEFLATFKSKQGEKTEGGLFVPLTEAQ